MRKILGKRSDFGSSWSEVVANWYLGNSPAIPDDIGWNASDVLERLWPDYLDKVLSKGSENVYAMANLVDLGITLAACENLAGFDEVLGRMKKNERAAFSEAFFAAELVKIGYVPVFGPWLDGKRLDALVNVQGNWVYVEMITPEQSKSMKQAYVEMNDVAKRLTEQNLGAIIDVYLLAKPTPDISDTILGFAKGVTNSQYNTTLEISNIAFLRYVPSRLQAQPLPFDPVRNRLGPVLLASTVRMKDGITSRVTVQFPFTDKRAERLMDDKVSQFSRQEMNLLVIDVSSIPDGIRQWSALIKRRLRPEINRRFGAVVLFFRYFQIQDATIKTRWSVLRNPNAYRLMSESLLNAIMNFNDYSDLIRGNKDSGNGA